MNQFRSKHLMYLSTLLAFQLVGCAGGRDAELEQKASLARSDCRKQFPFGQRKSAVDLAKCIAAADEISKDTFAHPDLVRLRNAQIIQASEKYKNGEITEADLSARIAEIEVNGRSEWEKRELTERSVKAQEAISRAATSTKTTSCTTYSGGASCTTY